MVAMDVFLIQRALEQNAETLQKLTSNSDFVTKILL